MYASNGVFLMYTSRLSPPLQCELYQKDQDEEGINFTLKIASKYLEQTCAPNYQLCHLLDVLH